MTATRDWAAVTPEELQQMIDEGKSYGDIAELFQVSRNSVSGQVYRWRQEGKLVRPAHLLNRKKRQPKPKPPKAPKPRGQFVPSGKTIRNPPPPAYQPPAPPPPKTLAPPTNPPVSPLELAHDMCAYVVQTDPYMYCGCRQIANRKFRLCAYHAEGFFARRVDPEVAERRRAARSLDQVNPNRSKINF